MPQPDLNRLRETLLRGGIAPKHVRRYIGELKDHADDLVRDGASTNAAWAQVGSEETLAAEMLQRVELKSLGGRYPGPYFGLGPVALLLMAMFLSVAALISFITVAKATFGTTPGGFLVEAAYGRLGWFQGMADGLSWFLKFALPVILGSIFAVQAVQQRSEPKWVFLGVVLIAIVGGASDISIIPPAAPGAHGELQVGFGWYPPFPDVANSLFRAALNLVLLAPGLVWLMVKGRSSQVSNPSR